jgi:glyoxylate reductase
MTFLVTTKIPTPGMEILASAGPVDLLPAPPTAEHLAQLCASGDYDVVVAQLRDDLGAAILERAALRGVSVYAVGVNNVDLDAATRRGIVVANTPDVLTDATADVAMLLMLAAARRAVEADRFLREGRFQGWEPELLLGRDISGSTLGLAGFGRIARATARRALGFGMRVLYCSRPPGDTAPSDRDLGDLTGRVERAPWPELVARSDVLSLHVPLTTATHHLVDKAVFAAMKSDAVLVNTARGPVVDEKALVETLRTGAIAAAGLDVYEDEPALAPGLVEMTNTVLLPHVGSATRAVRAAMARMCAENAVALSRGELPAAAVNPQAWTAGFDG